MKSIIGTFLFVLALTSLALAVQISGTLECGKPDPQYSIPVGDDHPGHAVQIEQYKCTWTKPMEIGGVATKDGLSVESGEKLGTTIHASGFHTTNMANNDLIFVTYKGTIVIKDDKPVTSKGTWSFVGGKGKFLKVKGNGTFDGTPTPDGGVSFAVKGRYTLP